MLVLNRSGTAKPAATSRATESMTGDIHGWPCAIRNGSFTTLGSTPVRFLLAAGNGITGG